MYDWSVQVEEFLLQDKVKNKAVIDILSIMAFF